MPESTTTKAPTLEPENWGDPTGKGMMGRLDELDKIFESGSKPDTKQPDPFTPEPEKASEPTPEPPPADKKPDEVAPKEPEAKDPDKKDDEEEVIPELKSEFFDDVDPDKEEQESEKSAFDESEFDAQTQKLVKALEEKGHPGDAYRDLRAELKEAQKAAATVKPAPEVEKELNELRSKAEEAEGLRERLKEVSSSSARLQVESSDEYQNQVLAPVQKILDRADELSEAYSVDVEAIRAILRETDVKARDAALKDLTDTLGPMGSIDVARLATGYSELKEKREQMLSNAEAELEKQKVAQIQQDEQAIREHREIVKKLQKATWESNKALIPGFVDESGEETSTYKTLMSKAMSIDFSTARAKDQAFAAYSGVVLPHVVKEIGLLRQKLAKYEKKDAKDVETSPSPSKTLKGGPAPIKDGKPKTFAQSAAEVEFS